AHIQHPAGWLEPGDGGQFLGGQDASGVELVEWCELSDAQRLTIGCKGGECRLDPVSETSGSIVLAYSRSRGSSHGGSPGVMRYRSVPLVLYGTMRYHGCQEREPLHPCQHRARMATTTPRHASVSSRPPSRRSWKMATRRPALSKSPRARAF